jgi:hypothetical protein
VLPIKPCLSHSSKVKIIITVMHNNIKNCNMEKYFLVWPWDGHYKSILLPADEEIMGSL